MPRADAILLDLDELVQQLGLDITRSAGGSTREWARRHRVTHQYVNNVLNGKDKPGRKIAEALGYDRVVLYRRK